MPESLPEQAPRSRQMLSKLAAFPWPVISDRSTALKARFGQLLLLGNNRLAPQNGQHGSCRISQPL